MSFVETLGFGNIISSHLQPDHLRITKIGATPRVNCEIRLWPVARSIRYRGITQTQPCSGGSKRRKKEEEYVQGTTAAAGTSGDEKNGEDGRP